MLVVARTDRVGPGLPMVPQVQGAGSAIVEVLREIRGRIPHGHGPAVVVTGQEAPEPVEVRHGVRAGRVVDDEGDARLVDGGGPVGGAACRVHVERGLGLAAGKALPLPPRRRVAHVVVIVPGVALPAQVEEHRVVVVGGLDGDRKDHRLVRIQTDERRRFPGDRISAGSDRNERDDRQYSGPPDHLHYPPSKFPRDHCVLPDPRRARGSYVSPRSLGGHRWSLEPPFFWTT